MKSDQRLLDGHSSFAQSQIDFIRCAAHGQIGSERALGTVEFVSSLFSFAPNYCVVTMFHIVVLITTGHRT